MKTSPNSLTKAGWMDALRFCLQTDDIHLVLKGKGGLSRNEKGNGKETEKLVIREGEKTQRENEKRE